MSRPEMRWVQENRRIYYEGLNRMPSQTPPVEEERAIKRSPLDSILFSIIKGLLACLFIVIIVATLCSAEGATDEALRTLHMTPEAGAIASCQTTHETIQTIETVTRQDNTP